jgi:hypothetical protein
MAGAELVIMSKAIWRLKKERLKVGDVVFEPALKTVVGVLVHVKRIRYLAPTVDSTGRRHPGLQMHRPVHDEQDVSWRPQVARKSTAARLDEPRM